jgi:aminomethyltransferase
MENLKRTPLYDFHVRHGARMVPFAGWEMPVQYQGILEEHRAVRERAGLFDVSHMGEVRVFGPQAEEFLDFIATNDISRCRPGQAIYSLMCYQNGGVVDDIIVYRLKSHEFFVCINAGNTTKDVEWFKKNAEGWDCSVEDVSSHYGQLALQGPDAVSILTKLWTPAPTLQRFQITHANLLDVDCLISRTGYTGEDGVEIYCPAPATEKIAEKLLELGSTNDALALTGLGARDSLRLEAGYPLYGHEISEHISPLKAGLGWAVKLKKGREFIGQRALLEEKRLGPAQNVIFFKLENRRIAREGTPVLSGGREVGRVLSGTLSPILGQAIGSALVDTTATQPLMVDLRGHQIPLVVSKPPLHKTAA